MNSLSDPANGEWRMANDSKGLNPFPSGRPETTGVECKSWARQRSNSGIVAVALCVLGGPSAAAQLSIDLDSWSFPAAASSFTFDVHVNNSGAALDLLGVNLNLQIADGGPGAGGSVVGPSITDIDLFTSGMVFGANNNGAGGSGAIVPQLFEVGTLASPGTHVTLAPGLTLLARVTLDTSATTVGQSWPMTMNTLNGSSTFLNLQGNPITPSLSDGMLYAVPEPAGWAAAAGLSLLGWVGLRLLRGNPSGCSGR